MNPVVKAINDIKATIPKEILDLAYNNEYNSIETIESKLERTIKSRVLVDTNLVGGVTMYVHMYNAIIIEEDEYGGSIVEIPEKLLNGKSILSVHSLVTAESTGGLKLLAGNDESACSSVGGSLLQEANKIKTNLDNIGVEVTSNLEVIGERTIHIRDPITNLADTVLRLVVENQNLLGNLPPRAYINFSILVSRAIKADIYNKLIVKMDEGIIHNGHQLGVVQRIVDKYEDMNDMYLEYLTNTWTSVAFQSDATEMASYITSLFGNNS